MIGQHAEILRPLEPAADAVRGHRPLAPAEADGLVRRGAPSDKAGIGGEDGVQMGIAAEDPVGNILLPTWQIPTFPSNAVAAPRGSSCGTVPAGSILARRTIVVRQVPVVVPPHPIATPACSLRQARSGGSSGTVTLRGAADIR